MNNEISNQFDLKTGVKKQDQLFFNFLGMYTVESIKSQNQKKDVNVVT